MTPLKASQRTITALLAPLGRAYRKQVDRAFLGFGVSHTLGLPVMLLGRLDDGVRQSALAEALGVEPPSLVPLLDQLERAELLERRPCLEDKRAKTLHLTPAGRDLAARAEIAADSVRSQLLGGISATDLETTARVLARFQRNMDDRG
ncbi:MAG: MarR family transcriptional regulator [Asticcacaulis sp.]|uniref:MarR family winged helix-turn-helix transcriptional regulator n=1 Tax=Asticcacaulis sp. TaxID=1872648 RepID=UPI0039E2D3E6